jgi:hypothetical protein
LTILQFLLFEDGYYQVSPKISGVPMNNIMKYFSALIISRFPNEHTSVKEKIEHDFGKILRFVAFLLICLTVSARAQIAPQLSADERTAALKSIKEKFQDLYVIPEMRPAIIERLNKAQQSGRYEVNDPYVFAERVTEDLKDVAHDEHLSLSYNQPAYKAALAPPQSDAGEEAFRHRRAIRNNHGLTEMRILPGNIRYLKIIRFEWVPDETGAIYDEAMRFLKGGDAWIIDLRGNGGGTSSAANYFLSHFHAAGTFSYTSYAGSEMPQRTPALDYLPAGRLRGKPLYVLINGNVGSAAEAVAYDLQQFKIATLVGAKTAGAANNNKLLPIAPGFILSISYGRPLHIITKTNWEGIGVKPDIECNPAIALDTAESLVLKQLAELPGVLLGNLTEYNWARTAVEARLHPVILTTVQMNAWSGRFSNVDYGEVKVSFIEGVLWLERPGRPRTRLSPLTANGVFAIEGTELLRARLTGKTLELLWWEYPNPRIFVRN